MRSGAAAGHVGYFHEAAFYADDDEFVEIVAPFLEEGLAAGEPAVVACAPHNTALLRDAVGDRGVRFLPGTDHYSRPGPTMRAYRSLFAELVASGAPQVRVIGDVPHPGVGMDWYGWLRYEAAVNTAYDDFALWGLCPYDLRTTPDDVLQDVRRTHAHLADAAGGHHRNDLFVDPSGYLATHPSHRAPLPVAGPPAATLVSPSGIELRAAVRELATGILPAVAVEDLLIAASEILVNAQVHGRPPVSVRLWSSADEVTVAVADRGTGPKDPLTGFLPPPVESPGGRGLWIANQLCSDVRTSYADGFEVALTMRAATE
jgi:anti-sigma regulatory factor (Ser/Thr protein kinase)